MAVIYCGIVNIEAKNAYHVRAEINNIEEVNFELNADIEKNIFLDAIGKDYVKKYFDLIEEGDLL